uniref:Neurotensin/neuromedin N n=1 Tax=Oncorhynchus tshawytscha TaxID=74940 RepID=A0A8C8LV83_ONCTS
KCPQLVKFLFVYYSCGDVWSPQSKQNAPYWRVSLVNVCRMVNSLINSRLWREQVEYNTGEDFSITLMYTLSLLHPVDYLDADQNSDNPLKRKSPYIFKRQVKNTKARRPYILKRSTFY